MIIVIDSPFDDPRDAQCARTTGDDCARRIEELAKEKPCESLQFDVAER